MASPFQLCFLYLCLFFQFQLVVSSSRTLYTVNATSSTSTSTSSDGPPIHPTPAAGWTHEGMQCLNDMEEADSTYDHILNHHEYFIFCDTMANRIFDMLDALNEEAEWELVELYEHLILQNPSNETRGIDVKGSSYDSLWSVDEEQELHLKEICTKTAAMLQKIGPDVE